MMAISLMIGRDLAYSPHCSRNEHWETSTEHFIILIHLLHEVSPGKWAKSSPLEPQYLGTLKDSGLMQGVGAWQSATRGAADGASDDGAADGAADNLALCLFALPASPPTSFPALPSYFHRFL